MDRTEATIRKLLAALPATGYDLGILNDRGMYRLEAVPESRILRMLPYLKFRNANGSHIYIRPTGESSYTLLDDLTAATLQRLGAEGYAPAAVVETSPGSFQAWLRHLQPLPKELGTLVAKTLAERFGADRSAADWRRFGRAPGFTNRKPQHRKPHGLYPFARLIRHTGQLMPNAAALRLDLEVLQKKAKQERATLRLSFAARPSRFPVVVSLSRFRSSPRYQGRPAAADMALCIAACSKGLSESDIAAALSRDYLSRDPSRTRQNSYIQRTIAKAIPPTRLRARQGETAWVSPSTLIPPPSGLCSPAAHRGQVPPFGLSPRITALQVVTTAFELSRWRGGRCACDTADIMGCLDVLNRSSRPLAKSQPLSGLQATIDSIPID